MVRQKVNKFNVPYNVYPDITGEVVHSCDVMRGDSYFSSSYELGDSYISFHSTGTIILEEIKVPISQLQDIAAIP